MHAGRAEHRALCCKAVTVDSERNYCTINHRQISSPLSGRFGKELMDECRQVAFVSVNPFDRDSKSLGPRCGYVVYNPLHEQSLEHENEHLL